MITMCLIFLLLYRMGYLTVSLKRAAVFLGWGSWKKRCLGASFTGCSGKIQRLVRFDEGRSYSFRLSGRVQQGRIRVRLLHRGSCLLELTPAAPSAVLPLEPCKPYCLQLLFDHASGDFQLEWD